MHCHHYTQVALKTAQLGVFYWDDSIPLAAALEEGGTLEPTAYMGAWRAIAAEAKQQLNVSIGDVEAAKAKLAAGNVFVLAHRPVSSCTQLLFSCAVYRVSTCCLLIAVLRDVPAGVVRLLSGSVAVPVRHACHARTDRQPLLLLLCCRCPTPRCRRSTSPARRRAWRSCS
jgi:hypothetical protein